MLIFLVQLTTDNIIDCSSAYNDVKEEKGKKRKQNLDEKDDEEIKPVKYESIRTRTSPKALCDTIKWLILD